MPSPKESNPFLVSEKKEDPTLDIALQALAIETSRRTASESVPSLSVQPCQCNYMYMCRSTHIKCEAVLMLLDQ